MEISDLITDAFWRDRSTYAALAVGESTAPSGLIETATPHLPEGGCLFRTSGSTGAAKWVALEKRAFLHSARVVNAHYDLSANDHWLLTLPLHHVGGFSIAARAWLAKSRVTALTERWHVPTFIHSLHNRKITVTSLVPTQLHDIVSANQTAPDSLRLVIVGGGRTSPELMQRALTLGWNVCATYGMTETASQVASQPLEHNRFDAPETMEILPHWEARTSETGRLILRGPALARGYLKETSQGWQWDAIDPEIGLTTRDRVRLWSLGTRWFLQFLGRDELYAKVLGEIVSLEALEGDLRRLAGPEFPEIAIVTQPDARRENNLVLAIEAATPPEQLADLISRFHENRPGYQHLSAWQCLPSFPRSELGKLKRAELQQLLANRTLQSL